MPGGSEERLTRAKRVLVTPTEEQELAELMTALAGALGTSVRLSHVQRALLRLLQHAGPEVLDLAQRADLSRPPNEIPEARDEFEQALANLLHIAFRKARGML
jgi:hypothetical protein